MHRVKLELQVEQYLEYLGLSWTNLRVDDMSQLGSATCDELGTS
jgi:hypothetical protein